MIEYLIKLLIFIGLLKITLIENFDSINLNKIRIITIILNNLIIMKY